MTTSAAISAGSNLLGGLLGGGDSGPSVTKTMKMQRAMNDIDLEHKSRLPTVLVDAAKRAGLHPAVVMGSGIPQSQAISVGQVGGGGNNWGANMASMGQDISRAIDANRDYDERRAYREAITGLDQQASIQQTIDNAEARERQKNLDDQNAIHMGLQNDLLRSQIRRLDQQAPPPMAPKRTGSSHVTVLPKSQAQRYKETDQYEITPSQVNSADSRAPGNTAGPRSPGYTTYRIGGKHLGFNYDLPAGGNMSEAMESLGSPMAMGLNVAHGTLSAFDRYIHGPRDLPTTPLPPGYRWSWNNLTQSWRAKRMQKGGK
ncbi:DNA pilot protein [Apis mellifera associated microvirus 53]|nr:DNA pilot protein [Apis mellifera associated microvirus 53]